VGTAVSVILSSVCYFSNQLNAWSRTILEHTDAVQVISFGHFWDMEVCCDVHENPLQDPVVGQMNPVHTLLAVFYVPV
jgi:hypothetical protein